MVLSPCKRSGGICGEQSEGSGAPRTVEKGRKKELKRPPTKDEIGTLLLSSTYIRLQPLRNSLINLLMRSPQIDLSFAELVTLTRGDVTIESDHSFCFRDKRVSFQRDLCHHLRMYDDLRAQCFRGGKACERADAPYFIRNGGGSLLIGESLPGIPQSVGAAYLASRDKLLGLLMRKYELGFDLLLCWPVTEVRKLGQAVGRDSWSLSRSFVEGELANTYVRAREAVEASLTTLSPEWSQDSVSKVKRLGFISLTGQSLTGD